MNILCSVFWGFLDVHECLLKCKTQGREPRNIGTYTTKTYRMKYIRKSQHSKGAMGLFTCTLHAHVTYKRPWGWQFLSSLLDRVLCINIWPWGPFRDLVWKFRIYWIASGVGALRNVQNSFFVFFGFVVVTGWSTLTLCLVFGSAQQLAIHRFECMNMLSFSKPMRELEMTEEIPKGHFEVRPVCVSML